MKVVSTAEMRQLEAVTISDFEESTEILMDRAGNGVAVAVDDFARMAGFSTNPVRLVAGRGNNGGDVLVAARYLAAMGYRLELWIAGERRRLSAASAKALEQLRDADVNIQEVCTPQDWESLISSYAGGQGVVVDGVLGTGLRGPARGPAAAAIQFINSLRDSGPVVAVDIPSGLDADTGAAEADTVHADLTVTMGLPKRGLVMPAAIEHVGAVEVADIGIDDDVVAQIASDLELMTSIDARRLVPRRRRQSHKGDYGHVLVIAGAAGFSGAATLTTRAAARSGAGLVSALVPEGVAAMVAVGIPEAMVHGGRQTDGGSLAADAWRRSGLNGDRFDAVVIGPGLTTHPDSRLLVLEVLEQAPCPVVLDADALNVLGPDALPVRRRRAPVVITPHPGELGRLLGRDPAAIQADRHAAARAAAAEWNCVVTLKGAGSLVAATGQPLQINLTGNPGMATGGMGDVLAGVLGGLLAQGLQPYDAARLAVYLHGRAGDRVAWTSSQAGMLAGDVVESLAHVFADLVLR